MNKPRAPPLALANELARLRGDPVGFVRTVLKVEPEPWQIDFLESIRDKRFIRVRSGQSVGKSSALSWAILWLLLTTRPVMVMLTGANLSSIDQTTWKEFKAWYFKLPKVLQNRIEILTQEAHVLGPNGPLPDQVCHLVAARKDNQYALQGRHEDNLIFIIDEAGLVDNEVFEVAMGRMDKPGCKMILTGNPNFARGYFYERHTTMAEDWHVMHIRAFDVPNRVDQEKINRIGRQYGVDRNQYRVRVLGEFPLVDDDVVIPRPLLEAAAKRDIRPSKLAPMVWGLDVGRTRDRRCLARRRGDYADYPLMLWKDKDGMQLADILHRLYQRTPLDDRPVSICVDSIGVGTGPLDRMKQLGLPVEGVNVRERPSRKEHFSRLGDELWFRCKDWLEKMNGRIVNDPALINEIRSRLYGADGKGRTKIEKKDDWKKRNKGKSPDRADAFILTFMNTGVNQAFFSKPMAVDTRWVT